MFPRMICPLLVLAGVLAAGVAQAQQPASTRPIARVTGLQGNVLVSEADGMAAAVDGQQLAPGARLITTAGAKVTITYERGCLVHMGENQRYTVREAAECTAAKAPPLGAATPFAVLAGPQVVNSGGSVIRGDLGVSPGTRVDGFPGGKVIDGTIQTTGDTPNQAQKDAAKAYADLASQQCNVKLIGQDLGGQTLTPGVYCFPSAAATLTGELVLDAQGDPNAVFVFQVGTTLTTAARSRVRVTNSGQDANEGNQSADSRTRRRDSLCHVYWQVGTSATIGRDSNFIGTIIAMERIGVATNATIDGRALARTGNVTMDTNAVEIPQCVLPFAYMPEAVMTVVGTGVVVYEIRKPKSPN
jgi:uncharacterized Zn-binding protein involved in type VI secretion